MPKHGSTLESFLREEGIYEEVHAKAVKSLLAYQLAEQMAAQKITKVALAQRMDTSRSQIDRILDPANAAVSIEMAARAAHAIGYKMRIQLEPDTRHKLAAKVAKKPRGNTVQKPKGYKVSGQTLGATGKLPSATLKAPMRRSSPK